MLVSGPGVQSQTLGFQGKNLQDRATEVVAVADGMANSGRQEDKVQGRQAGADNLPRAIAMNVLTLHLSKLRTSHIQIWNVFTSVISFGSGQVYAPWFRASPFAVEDEDRPEKGLGVFGLDGLAGQL